MSELIPIEHQEREMSKFYLQTGEIESNPERIKELRFLQAKMYGQNKGGKIIDIDSLPPNISWESLLD